MNAVASHTADRIRALHAEAQQCARTAVDRAIEAGRLLTDAKVSMAHGEFQPWVIAKCGLNLRTARRYMRAYTHRNELPQGLGLRAALEHVADKTDSVTALSGMTLPPEVCRVMVGSLINATERCHPQTAALAFRKCGISITPKMRGFARLIAQRAGAAE